MGDPGPCMCVHSPSGPLPCRWTSRTGAPRSGVVWADSLGATATAIALSKNCRRFIIFLIGRIMTSSLINLSRRHPVWHSRKKMLAVLAALSMFPKVALEVNIFAQL